MDAFLYLGRMATKRGDSDKAIEYYEKALMTYGKKEMQVDVLLELGNIYINKSNNSKALYNYTQGLRIDPKNYLLHNNVGNVFLNEKIFDKAIECYGRAIEINPNYAGAYYNLANAYLEQGRLDEAEKLFKKVLELSPGEKLATDMLQKVRESRAKASAIKIE
jgi:pentatricopeptide repeat protein